jgi:glutathione S-transferase
MSDRPVLWHIPVSHYNEKARWALDYKGVEHDRRAPPPPAHMAVSLWLTRGSSYTFPVLQIGGRAYGDSSEIIRVLEERVPEPALYPAEPGERRRALEIEDFIDEEVAPHLRLLAFHEAIKDPDGFGEFSAEALPPAMRKGPGPRIAGSIGARFLKTRFKVGDPQAAAAARERVEAGFDRIERELGDGDYLVGDRFSVADLTAAAIFYPLVMPPEGPRFAVEMPAAFEEYRASFADRRAYRWVGEMFARHRKSGRVGQPAGAPA